jgi:hypothetical protein
MSATEERIPGFKYDFWSYTPDRPHSSFLQSRSSPLPPKWLASHNYIYICIYVHASTYGGDGQEFYAGVKTGGGATGMSAPGLPVVLIGRGG